MVINELLSGYFHSIMAMIVAGGNPMQAAVRSELIRPAKTPLINLVMPTNWKGKIDDDGIVIIPADQAEVLHIGWNVANFDVAAPLSGDPVTDYLDGRRVVSNDNKEAGHAHLHVCSNRDWPQAANAINGKPGVTVPSGYRFFGGPKWYRYNKMPDGTWNITQVLAIGFVPGQTTRMEFELVGADDSQLNGELHGQTAGRLVTIFRCEAK